MSVYITNTQLIADRATELHAMAASLGIARMEFRVHYRLPHYELKKLAQQKRAVELGAVSCDAEKVIELMGWYSSFGGTYTWSIRT